MIVSIVFRFVCSHPLPRCATFEAIRWVESGVVACGIPRKLGVLVAGGYLAMAATGGTAEEPAASGTDGGGPLPAGVVVEDSIVRFAQEIDVPALESGALEELRTRQNESVQAGELIARQDASSLLIRKRSALLQRQAAQEQLSDDLDLQYAQAARAEANAELEANRGVYNEASGAVPLSLLRKLRLAVERAELEVARAEKKRRLAQIDVELRAADLDLIDNQLGRLEMTSPVTGVVLEAYAEPGEWVAAGDPVARVARLDRILIHALCSIERLPPEHCRNQVVTVIWSTQEGRRVLRGRVTSVDPELLGDGRYRLHAEVENRREGERWWLLPGTEVQMTVHPVQAVSPPTAADQASPAATKPANRPAAKQAERRTPSDRGNRLRAAGGFAPR